MARAMAKPNDDPQFPVRADATLRLDSTALRSPVADGLLVAAGHRDVDALAAFYDRTAPAVFGFLQSLLGRGAHVEHVTEQVYLQLWRTAPRFDPATESASSRLLRAARRELAHRPGDILRSPR